MGDDRFIVRVRNCVRDQGARDPTMDCEIIAPQEFTPGRLHCLISFVPICTKNPKNRWGSLTKEDRTINLHVNLLKNSKGCY
jgi:hypothetical protein